MLPLLQFPGGTPGATLPWPGDATVVTVDAANAFPGNLSGLFYQPGAPSTLWAVRNGPSVLYKLTWNGTTWGNVATSGWNAGKTVRYISGGDGPDAEGITGVEAGSPAIYVSTERDNANGGVSRLSVLRYDTSVGTTNTLTATHDWNLTADLPSVSSNAGLEAITWVPDSFLVASGFIDESTSQPYDPARYPNHGAGLIFVGLEGNGGIYAYALDHATAGAYHRVASIKSGQGVIMDLAFDRDVGNLWAYCDNGCANKATVLRMVAGRFTLQRFVERPTGLPDSNNEGIAIAPESECQAGKKSFFWADDGFAGGHAIRQGSLFCGPIF